jgi:hypothetical protein
LLVATALTSACGHVERSPDATSGSAHFQGVIAADQAVSLEVAANIGADILVMGTNGRGVTLDAVPADGFSGVTLTTSNEHLQHHADATIELSMPRDSAISIHAVKVPKGFRARVQAHTLFGPLERSINDSQAPGVVKLRLVAGPVSIREK